MTNETLGRFIQKISHLLPIVLFIGALYIVHNQLKIHDLSDIVSSLKTVPLLDVFAAFALTLINYLVLAGYDWLALRFTGHKQIPVPQMIAAALLSYAISNNTGHAWAAGGSIRYRFYSKWGVPGWDVLKISLFQTATYLLGALSLGLVGSLLLPHYLSTSIQEPQAIHWVSLICAASLLAYWGAIGFWRKPLLIKGFELTLPTPAMALWQTLIASIDVILSSLVLWVLLLGKVDIGFGAFVVVFVVAQVAGVISQVPGGIGVFESAFLWLMSDIETTDQHLILIGALLLYRVIYYFVPLLLAGAGLLAYEIYSRREILITSSSQVRQVLTATVPRLYSLLLLLAGGLLLVSGSIPANSEFLDLLQDVVPLPVVELSHLTGSLTGVLLLFMARGIWLRIDSAWYGSLGLLSLGIIASLLKGFDWHEALVLLVILLLMLPTRSYFQRHSSLLKIPFSTTWLATMLMVMAGSIWLGLFAYRDVEYSHDLWWQFSFEGDAPRFLRTLLVMSVMTVAFALFRLFSVAPSKSLVKPTVQDLDLATEIVSHSADTCGYLALLGDKYLSWSEDRTAFIMYAVTPKYWIAMGDPVGAEKAFEGALWSFREQADHHGAKVVFYQISEALLPYYLDLGLSLLKLGEEAKVELASFSMTGRKRDSQRGARNRFTKLGFSFKILTGQQVEQALPGLRQISEKWLMRKNTREKGFSLGFFDETYLRRTDVAVVLDENGQIAAFANLWQTLDKQELSLDLMRYDPDITGGVMEYLFIELILWGQQQGFRWFSLGMAPLSGLERRPLAPLWHKIGTIIFDLGDEFYNFEGLYNYKAKFDPVWQPRYLAVPSSFSVPIVMMTITRLISGGWKGVFTK
jgi:phosphatidylglycerol lysyltransferase